jgi:TRAP-type C4-dicarboxylate transport system permease small subunit
MVSKDQSIGGAILIVCVVVAIGYLVALFGYKDLIQPWLNIGSTADVRFWLIAVPVFVAFVAILFIGAWIGWTMATTPPPKPIEEITTEIEEKKEEPKAETEPEAPATEEKAVEKKK